MTPEKPAMRFETRHFQNLTKAVENALRDTAAPRRSAEACPLPRYGEVEMGPKDLSSRYHLSK